MRNLNMEVNILKNKLARGEKENVATLALARDQGKGVARLRAYK
jgi:hypothetical protein